MLCFVGFLDVDLLGVSMDLIANSSARLILQIPITRQEVVQYKRSDQPASVQGCFGVLFRDHILSLWSILSNPRLLCCDTCLLTRGGNAKIR